MELVLNDFVGDAAYIGFDQANPERTDFQWKTDIARFDNAKEQRNQILEQPVRSWRINWPFLDLAARDKLIEIFQRAKGMFDTFLWADRTDFETSLTDWSHVLSTGDATTQLQKTYYIGETEAWTEDKKNIQPSAKFAPIIKVDAATKTEGVDFTLDDTTGVITWTGFSPTDGEVLTANYYFYFRVRFDFDAHEDIKSEATFYESVFEIVEVIS